MLLIILIAVQLVLLMTLFCPSRSRFVPMTASFNDTSAVEHVERETDLGVLDRVKVLFNNNLS